jgi:hypothetical protein
MPEEVSRQRRKFLQYPDNAHVKNKESILRMCAAGGLDFEATNDRGRLNRADYDYLWLPMFWVSPDDIPARAKILYGPHHSVFPEGALIGPLNTSWAKRCVYTTLSDWNMAVFREFAPETTIPLAPLKFGVQEMPDVRQEPKQVDCLIYFKRRDPRDLNAARLALKAANLSFVEFSYGSYQQNDFLYALKRVKFALWIGSHESQGFAFQESLSMNVPILCWDATSMFDEHGSYKQYRGSKNLFATSATVWSSLCGERILRAYELPGALDAIQRNLGWYRPKEEILRGASDSVTMDAIIKYFDSVASPRRDIRFVTFGNAKWSGAKDRIIKEAADSGFFTSTVGYTEEMLRTESEFWSQNGEFCGANPRGFGFWCWKPFVILNELRKLKENDILVYADAGCTIQGGAKDRFKELVDVLDWSEYGLISFKIKQPYCTEKAYNKMDVLIAMDGLKYKDMIQYVGGIQYIRKCAHSIRVIEEWYKRVCNHHLIDDTPSVAPNDSTFREHRHDQSIYSLLVKSLGSVVLYDETDSIDPNAPIIASRRA